MKKVISIFLCIMIFSVPLFCFADGSPVLLPRTGVTAESVLTSPFFISSPVYTYYSSNDNDVYMVILDQGDGSYIFVVMSPSSTARLYSLPTYPSGSPVRSRLLSDYSGSYYYTSGSFSLSDTNIPVVSTDLSVSDYVSKFANDNSVVFNINDLVRGSVSWLSAVVDGVLQAPMLLFLILSSFVGIAIGLLLRFRKG